MLAALDDWKSSVEIVGEFLKAAPVDVDSMATALGLSVVQDANLPDGISGKIERNSNADSGFRVTINGRHHLRRRRFTLAHEIAHYVLHRDLIGDGVTDDALYRSGLSNDLEAQANRYAADILMPHHLVRAKWREGVRSYADMAAAFEVSPEVAAIRMRGLRLA